MSNEKLLHVQQIFYTCFGLKLQWSFLSVQIEIKKTTKTCNICFFSKNITHFHI